MTVALEQLQSFWPPDFTQSLQLVTAQITLADGSLLDVATVPDTAQSVAAEPMPATATFTWPSKAELKLCTASAGDCTLVIRAGVTTRVQGLTEELSAALSAQPVRLVFALPGLQHLLACYMHKEWWSRPTFNTDIGALPQRTQFLLWQRADGCYGVLVPLVAGGTRWDIIGAGTGTHQLALLASPVCHGLQQLPLAAAAVVTCDVNPYRAIARAYKVGMAASGAPGKLRPNKPFPPVLEYMGWCTWDAMHHEVNEDGILQHVRYMQQQPFPLGFVLIDDGWSPVKDRKLWSFGIDKDKFPRGLAPLVDDLKERHNVRAVGLWHNFVGYWEGVHPESPLYATHKEQLWVTRKGAVVPHPQNGFAFWESWHRWMRQQGVDFVKVDNQGAIWRFSRHLTPLGEAARGMLYNLQASAALHFQAQVINCMCMATECAWHWVSAPVARSSDDFMPGGEISPAEHARQNLFNALWYGQLAHCDFDMWWTKHPQARFHQALRAISGGPVYVSDPPGQTNPNLLWPLVTSTGRLLRCDNPPQLTLDSLFCDPEHTGAAVKVFNTAGNGAVVGAFHCSGDTPQARPVQVSIRPADVAGFSQLPRPEKQQFAAREFYSGTYRLLSMDEAWQFNIAPDEACLVSLTPVTDGLAVLGLLEKAVSVAGVAQVNRFADRQEITLVDGGRVLLYCAQPPHEIALADGSALELVGELPWLEVNVPCEGRAVTLVVRW